MSSQEFETEMMYGISCSVIKSIREKELITEEEYARMQGILLEKYHPILGTLLAGKLLKGNEPRSSRLDPMERSLFYGEGL